MAFASGSLMWNGIIGNRNGLPFVQMPVVSSLIMSASPAGGAPPIRGAERGHFGSGFEGSMNTGAPWRVRCGSSFPSLSRGV